MAINGMFPEKYPMKQGQSEHLSADKNNEGLGAALQTFLSTASMHGLNRLAEKRHNAYKAFWVITTLLSLIVLLVHIYNLTVVFHSNPIMTTLNVNYESFPFPDVTICNHRYLDSDILYSLVNQYLNISSHPKVLAEMTNVERARPDVEQIYLDMQKEYFDTALAYSETHGALFRQMSQKAVIWPLLNLTATQMASIFVPKNELIAVCSWGGDDCAPQLVKELADPNFMRCVTLRAPPDMVVQSGVEHGLSLISLVGSSMIPWSQFAEYRPFPIPSLSEHNSPLSGIDGLHVVVHEKGSLPLPMTEGVTIPPGYLGSLGITAHKYERLGLPFANCSSFDHHEKDRDEVYRLPVCLNRCIQKRIVEICGCTSPYQLIPSEIPPGTPSCSYVEPASRNCEGPSPPVECLTPLINVFDRLNCTSQVKTKVLSSKTVMNDCECYRPCKEYSYNIGFSLGSWPSGMETDSIWVRELKAKIRSILSSPNISDIKRRLYTNHFTDANRYNAMKDFVKANVYISDAFLHKTIETDGYPMMNMVSDVGGSMGLWVGMSVLSLIEVTQFVFDICVVFSKRILMTQNGTKIVTVVRPVQN